MLHQDHSHKNKQHESQKQINPEVINYTLSDCKSPLIGQGNIDLAHSPQVSHSSAMALWQQAQQLVEEKRINDAVEVLKRCIENCPDIQDQFIGLGCVEDRIGCHYGPLSEWVRIKSEEQGKKGSPYDLLSLCLSQGTNYQLQKQWYLNLLKKQPHSFRVMLGLAHLQYNNKKFKEAETTYKRASQLSPTSDQPFMKIAFIYCLKWNRDGEAAERAKQVLALNPKNCYAKLIAALCNRDLTVRIQELKELIEELPDYARPYNGLGNAYYNQKDYHEAINSYKKCIEVNKDYQHPYYGLGSIYNQLGDIEESIIWYKRCIEVSPNYDYPHYGLGIAYNNKNDMTNAIYWFKQCIRINPTYDCPYYALGNIYRITKDYHQAIHYYRCSLEHKPIDPLCFVNLALTLIITGKYQQAFGFFQQASTHLMDDKMLSPANIDYIKEQLEHYLKEEKKHERSCMGYITLRERIHLAKLQEEYRKAFSEP